MKDARLCLRRGLVQDPDLAFSADPTGGNAMVIDGPFIEAKEALGGLTVVDVADEGRQDVGGQGR
jgi:hypothetical protein